MKCSGSPCIVYYIYLLTHILFRLILFLRTSVQKRFFFSDRVSTINIFKLILCLLITIIIAHFNSFVLSAQSAAVGRPIATNVKISLNLNRFAAIHHMKWIDQNCHILSSPYLLCPSARCSGTLWLFLVRQYFLAHALSIDQSLFELSLPHVSMSVSPSMTQATPLSYPGNKEIPTLIN